MQTVQAPYEPKPYPTQQEPALEYQRPGVETTAQDPYRDIEKLFERSEPVSQPEIGSPSLELEPSPKPPPESPPALEPESPPALEPESPLALEPESPPALEPESPPALEPEPPPLESPSALELESPPPESSELSPQVEAQQAQQGFWSRLPWWAWVMIIGLLVVCLVLAWHVTRDDTPDTPKPTPAPKASPVIDHAILEWTDSSPPTDQKLQLLHPKEPNEVYGCQVATLMVKHKRVRLPVPRGEYLARAIFSDGTQALCPLDSGVELKMTATSMECMPLTDADVPDVPSTACTALK